MRIVIYSLSETLEPGRLTVWTGSIEQKGINKITIITSLRLGLGSE